MKQLEGMVAIVTGGSRGIGSGIADRFAAEGATVIVADVQAPGSAVPPGVFFRRHDVRDERSWHALMEATLSAHGKLDILVNNAGINLTGDILRTPLDEWRETFAVNTEGVLLGCRSAIPRMAAGGGGSIVNVTAAAAIRPGASQIAYTASKAAVISMTQSIALSGAATRIRCNSIAPGCIRSPAVENYYDQLGGEKAAIEYFAALHPVGRIGEPAEIAAAATYLAGRDSTFVTGSHIVVDGGYSISAVDGGMRQRNAASGAR